MPVDQAPWPDEIEDADPARWLEPLSAWLPARRGAGEAAALLGHVVVAEAQLAALRVELVMDLAAARPRRPARCRAGSRRARSARSG